MTLLEKDLEATIESYLVDVTGEYTRGSDSTFDKTNLVDPGEFVSFLKESQPDEWRRFSAIYSEGAEDAIVQRLRKEIDNLGLVEVLRRGISSRGIYFQVAYYRPETSFNPESERRYGCNRLTCIRQFHYSRSNRDSIDIVLLLNGIPVVSMELKNETTGQCIEDAKRQFMHDRDPSEPFLRFNRCNLVYIGMDTREACVTTRLDGERTRFMPFNLGSNGPGMPGGAGNPPAEGRYRTSYVWEHVLSKDCLLNMIRNYIHLIRSRSEDGDGNIRTVERMIFPRFHQMDAVDRLVADARAHGPGRNYLIEHSAGSGKSNSIAWLAYRLMSLHSEDDAKVFDSVIVITDRRNLDRQLQETISSFDHSAHGVVCNIDRNSRQLLDAINSGRKIIVTTLQKFPVIYEDVSVKGRRFAVIVDEAHSSQTGASASKVKAALGNGTSPDSEDGPEEDFQDRLARELRSHGAHSNLSFFAFTATPKSTTLELFGRRDEEGRFRAFHVYSMKQAIEEGYILNVLKHYATIGTYFTVAKSVAEDPEVELSEGVREVLRYVRMHKYNYSQKASIMIHFFMEHTARAIGGCARAMVVTDSRLSAVRYYQAFQRIIEDEGLQGIKALVAFTGTVKDPDDSEIEYTEEGMNRNSKGERIKEAQVPEYFRREFNVLIVADKYQTGFDEPLLQTMFVDKALDGVAAVQTLSRLNRVMPGKTDVYVLDFANDTDTIKRSFAPYYEDTELEEGVDYQSATDIFGKIVQMNVLDDAEIDAFGEGFYSDAPDSGKLNSLLQACADRANSLDDDERLPFRSALSTFCRRYSFIAQLVRMNDRTMQKRYVFCKHLLPLIRGADRETYGLENMIRLDRYRDWTRNSPTIEEVPLGSEPGLRPPSSRLHGTGEERVVLTSELVEVINRVHGENLTELDKIAEQLVNDIKSDSRVVESAKRNNEDTFKSMYSELFRATLIKRFKDNDAFFKILFSDKDAYGMMEDAVLHAAFRECRTRKEISDDERFASGKGVQHGPPVSSGADGCVPHRCQRP